MDLTTQLLERERATAEALLNRVRAVVLAVLAIAALAYAPRLTPALRWVNLAVLAPMLAWTVAQEILIHRRRRMLRWLAAANAAVDVTAVTMLLAGYGFAYDGHLAIRSPVFLAYLAVLAARPFTSSTRHAVAVAALAVGEYALLLGALVATGSIRLSADPLAALTARDVSRLDEEAKLLFLLVVGAISAFATWWTERTLRRAVSAQVARGAEEHALSVRLQEADKLAAVGALTAAMAHEVNNPLSVIATLAGLLQQSPLSESQRADARSIAEEAQRTAQVVREMLRAARPSRDEVELLSLEEVVSHTLHLLSPMLRKLEVDVRVDLPGTLPLMRGARARLEQVMLNLALNALQAMEAPELRGRRLLEVRARTRRGELVLDLADSGPGFAPGVGERIFERFYTTKPEGKGTGLGLWIVQQIVGEHGGRIEAGNRPEGGACFSLHFPAAPASAMPLSSGAAASAA